MVNRIGDIAKAGLASILIGLSSCSKSELTEAETFYQKFPDAVSLVGAREVVKYETPGSKHCLVHIRQKHYINPGVSLTEIQDEFRKSVSDLSLSASDLEKVVVDGEKMIARSREKIRSDLDSLAMVQKDIYLILDILDKKSGLDEVRGESVTQMLSREECKYYLSNKVQTLHEMGFATESEIIDSNKYLMVGGALFLLGMNGNLVVKEAEDIVLNTNAWRLRDKLGDESWAKPREDHVLKLISKDKEDYSVVVFGADHDFKDNVDEWNNKNPNDKFSLIVVTPENYRK